MPMTPRRILIVDDHALVRSGIRLLVESLDGVEVVAETGDGLEALELVQCHRPDILLLDLTLPGLNGLELLERMRELPDMPRVIVLSMHAGPEYVARALNAGAGGYLLKDSAFDELAAALDAVGERRRYLSRALDPGVIERFCEGLRGGEDDLGVLTRRQRQILQLIAEGQGTRQIAERLHVSVKTVETHRAQLMERLGIHDVAGLVRFPDLVAAWYAVERLLAPRGVVAAIEPVGRPGFPATLTATVGALLPVVRGVQAVLVLFWATMETILFYQFLIR